ncbi:predicted protein [Botrytis cinerea T4]|uniref:Uncharacterized protein n=1 Tax=Botryotinia fuckeliana (strain T4) TaxID=999810 RepID=G2YEK5_BOTF4|nr:predicted protein [Botrytis cinerea T4]
MASMFDGVEKKDGYEEWLPALCRFLKLPQLTSGETPPLYTLFSMLITLSRKYFNSIAKIHFKKKVGLVEALHPHSTVRFLSGNSALVTLRAPLVHSLLTMGKVMFAERQMILFEPR